MRDKEFRARGRSALALALGVLSLAAGCARTQPYPHVILIAASGTGFPFEDPTLSRYPALNALRQSSRPFDSIFTDDPAWARATAVLLGEGGRESLVESLKARGYGSASYTSAGNGSAGFDHAAVTGPTDIASRILESLDAADQKPAFVFAAMDLGNVPAAAPPRELDAPPLEVPAIALSDRGPLDPLQFPVTPPPREPGDRSALAARRDTAFMVLDQEVGVVMNGLKERNLLTKTIVVLVSTGPAPMPERAAPPRPDLLFEDWLRGQALIRAPGLVQPGTPASTLALMTDIAPTVASLVGASSESAAGGLDLTAAVRNPREPVRQTLLGRVERRGPRVGRSVRSARFRYTQWPDGSEELFDEYADPGEWTNLASLPAIQSQKVELAKRLGPLEPPAPAAPARAADGKRPNVLMIIADDLTSQYPQFGEVKTPNMDRLSARGRSYERAYAPAPYCTPARAAFLSGLSPARLQLEREDAYGEVFTADIPLIQEQFRSNGYRTVSVGKVWDSQPGEARGWDVNEWLPPLRANEVEQPAALMINMPVSGGPTTNADDVEGDGRRARFAAGVLQEKRDEPLFMALGLVRPHLAWIAPRKYFDMYPPARMTFTPAPDTDADDIPAIAIKNRPESLPGLMLSGREPGGLSNDRDEALRGRAAYLACVTFMDAQLGVILDALDREDRWRDTIVVFFGDNGHHLGEHGGLWRKNTLFEESLRVPMIIAAPGLARPGTSTEALADLIDIYPTLVELTGISRPGTLDGVSLVPTLENPRASVQEAVIQYRPTEPPRAGYSLRTLGHRYTLWPDGSEELYDLSVDPAGRHNLAGDPGQAATRIALRKQLESMVP